MTTTTFRFRPLALWPGGAMTPERKRSPFDSHYNQTLDLLRFELGKVNAIDVVIQLAVRERDLNRDGLPYSGVRPEHPGVVLSFTKVYADRGRWVHEPLMFPCDTFLDWQDNLRAIALSLEALRKVDRYGVTQRGQQYTGFRALPSGQARGGSDGRGNDTRGAGAVAGNGMTAQAAAEMLAALSPYSAVLILTQASTAKDAIRVAMNRAHPQNGGSDDKLRQVYDARDVLKAHLGLSTL